MFGNFDAMFAECVGLLSSGVLLGLYELYLRGQVRRNPDYRIQAVNDRAREAWVENIMTGRTPELLAVHTLRNSTMAAVFLASTAILLIMGVVNLGPVGLRGVVSRFDLTVPASDAIWVVRLLPLLLDLFWAFFCFTLAIRAYNHVGYLINAGYKSFYPTPTYVAQLLNQGAGYFTFGMRAYYISVPLIFGLFNPVYLVTATVVIIAVLYRIDRAPDVGNPRVHAVADVIPATPSHFRVIKGSEL